MSYACFLDDSKLLGDTLSYGFGSLLATPMCYYTKWGFLFSSMWPVVILPKPWGNVLPYYNGLVPYVEVNYPYVMVLRLPGS